MYYQASMSPDANNPEEPKNWLMGKEGRFKPNEFGVPSRRDWLVTFPPAAETGVPPGSACPAVHDLTNLGTVPATGLVHRPGLAPEGFWACWGRGVRYRYALHTLPIGFTNAGSRVASTLPSFQSQ